MVNILSRHQDGFSGSNQKIVSGPLYSDILKIIDSSMISLATRQCRRDVAELGKDEKSLKEAIKLAVKTGRFICSEWCQIDMNSWAACDAYNYYEKAWIEAAWKEMDCEFYVKFCIGLEGNIVLTISYHPPRQRH